MKMSAFQPKRIALLTLITLSFFLINSCGGDDDPAPTPTPTTETVSKTYKVGRNDHYGKGWKGGSAVVSANSNNTNKEIILSKTVTVNKSSVEKNKSATFDLDSVTVEWNDITVYKEKGVNLSNTTAVTDVSNNLDQYSHIITIPNIDKASSTWYVIQNKDTLGKVRAQVGVPSKAILSFSNKENTTTVDLSGTLEGYGTINIANIKVQEEYTYNEEVTFGDGNTDPRVVFKAVNSNTGKTVENLIVKYEGKEIPIDSTFIINRPYGDISLQMIESDSTWINFGDVTFNVKFEYDGQVFVDNTPLENKEIYANLSVDIDDQDNKDLPGVTLSSTGKTAKSNDNGRATINQLVELDPREDKPWLGKPQNIKYDLELEGYEDFPEKTVQVNSGDNVFSEKLTKSTSGNSAEFYVFARLNGKDLSNLEAKLVNTNDPSISYELTADGDVIHFPNVVPGEYTLITSDGEDDDRFENTTTIEEIKEGQNSTIVDVDAFENRVKVKTKVYDLNSLNALSNQTVYIVESDGDNDFRNNPIVGQKVTTGDGVTIEDLIPGKEYHVITEGANRYRKVNGVFVLDDVTRRSDLEVEKGITSVEMINNISADDIQLYFTNVFDIGLVTGEKRLVIPAMEGIDPEPYKEHFNEIVAALGLPNSLVYINTPTSKPSLNQVLGWNVYPENRNMERVSTDLNSYNGGNTTPSTAKLLNGNIIITHTANWQLAGGINNWSGVDHEFINAISEMRAHEIYLTSRSTNGAISIPISESFHDKNIMPLWFKAAVAHYNSQKESELAWKYE